MSEVADGAELTTGWHASSRINRRVAVCGSVWLHRGVENAGMLFVTRMIDLGIRV